MPEGSQARPPGKAGRLPRYLPRFALRLPSDIGSATTPLPATGAGSLPIPVPCDPQIRVGGKATMAATLTRTDASRQHSGKGSAARRAEGEAMLADQVRGMRHTALCEKYGVSRATLIRRLKEALDEKLPATAEARRGQLNASLDEQLAEWQRNLDAGTRIAASASTVDPETGLEVIDTAVLEKGLAVRANALAGIARVDERRAKLNGTDAIVKAEVTMTVETVQERELRDLLDQAAREQAAREAALTDEDVTA